MNRKQMTDELIEWDIESIRYLLMKDDTEFLDAVLRGDGRIPYNQLTDEQIKIAHKEISE